MRSICFSILVSIFLMSGCSNPTGERIINMNYSFNEPHLFPFEINEVRTEIAVDNPYVLQQYVFHYKNKQTLQEIRYILSKVMSAPEKISTQGKQRLELDNGKEAYYDEDETTQSIWWEGENGFLARFVYYINGNLDPIHTNKLEVSAFIDLANQIQ
ncbi:hypothetical protein C173_22917 [Paenibacillus sp. FSL R7-277]|uniref:hypothetical protein n=2 Tax=unclassified Paenibacillus TaxID=185978 RepID=UPI0003E299C3|nr:hypothetical protein C173_22917 [Paenibacillus sp. FSL R7-277]